MIEALCKKIKDKRQELGYSIEEVVGKTKLHPSVIRDIESCNFSNITPVFLKGFIKIYASFLGIKIENELTQLQRPGPLPKKPKEREKEADIGDSEPKQPASSAVKIISPRVKKNSLALLLVLIIFWLGFLGIRFSFRKVLGFFRNRPQVERKEAVSASEAVMPELAISQVRASLTAIRPCYIRVFVDDEIFFEGILDTGQVKSWLAKQELRFEIRDSSAVSLEVDGEPIPRLSALRRRKNVIINSSGITIE